ncbi:conjugal transfer protein TrbH [Sinorhizobium meliloti]|uniref:Probable conjugal transfer protein TrbH n=2 Tax=Rhizobium meliloti TaxID=382 RepID=A4KVR1_SINMM|nr:conjugal transfer protein TrbH [Sinorhizobium meliloti]ABN47162.1 probable conjugal transfer protein TrbH [Sinorhizobium meliloti SM11]ARS66162.1 conjugal transfer protein TrbH [Sinorhizobium meliloti RU11/001]MDE3765528.1 conjugal transfer protein TrbH [Sinorhizobium meliloti]MDE3779306.1 conjugal transfer protein TrbH [Sinorhizobium meliloti]MDE3804853.1 conjugal transfer protein TrbH [Sinorhizobium meliloti]
MKFRRFLPIVFALSLAGCQTATDGLSSSTAPADISGPAAGAIAGDMAGRFAEQAGSTATPIKLHRDTSEFAVALEAALKGWGFAVVTDEKSANAKDAPKPVELAYSILTADGQVLARLSTDTMELGRAYSVTDGVATPASPISLMKRN